MSVNEEQNLGGAVVDRETEQRATYERRRARAHKFADFLIAAGLRVGVRYDLILCEFDGVTFGIQESAERNAVESAKRPISDHDSDGQAQARTER